ncbi:MAG: hydroxylamine reductase, partial [Christensenellales bacterium]
MSEMFCFQCEQTAKGTGCTKSGVCGKKPDTANLQDRLTGELVALAKAASDPSAETYKVILEGLFTTITNVAFENAAIERQIERTRLAALQANPHCAVVDGCPEYEPLDMKELWGANEDVRSLKSLLLLGMRGMAAYAYHALMLGKTDDEVNAFFVRGLKALDEDLSVSELYDLVMEFGGVNLKCMALLDEANTSAYGTPEPTKVTANVEPGPFIVVTGHDLKDLEDLLKQTEGKGINIYTHGEMLPAHAYPGLKSYKHLKGNFGTAWQNQQKEFDSMPGAVLFTTNCLMPVRDSYKDRVFTTEVVNHDGITHIGEDKDFTPVIEKALELG